jgi:transmembrane sensor
MLDWNYISNISRLIERQILGNITKEESTQLENWRKESEANEGMYNKTVDETFLRIECQRRKLVNSERAKQDMLHRLGENDTRHHQWLIFKSSAITTISIAAVWAVIFFVLPHLSNNGIQADKVRKFAQVEAIKAGTTKATLTLADGSKVSLGSNTSHNAEVIKIAHRQEGIPQQNNNILSTPRGGEFKVTLEDGTVVWLNAQSQLYYPESFEGNERRVKLVGEAFFEVAKNPDKPFYVETDKQIVRVYGTKFNICSYADDPVAYTTLLSGSISLKLNMGNNSEVMLTPGHQALFERTTSAVNIHAVDAESVTSWRNGRFVFDDQSLDQIMRTLSRWYDFTYEFRNKSLKSTIFMGGISRYSDFGAVIETLEKCGNNIKFSISGHHVLISDNN